MFIYLFSYQLKNGLSDIYFINTDMGRCSACKETTRRSTGITIISELSTSSGTPDYCHNESKEFRYQSRSICQSMFSFPLISHLISIYFFFVFIQLYLIINGKRVKKKKSSTGKSGDPKNPIWNEVFTFNFSQSNLQNAAIEVN